MGFPDFGYLVGLGGSDQRYSGVLIGLAAGASNISVGSNPPYTVVDFLGMYPQFGGQSSVLTGGLTSGENLLTAPAINGAGTNGFGQGGFGVIQGGEPIPNPPAPDPTDAPSTVPGWNVGQLVSGPGIPPGTIITAINPNGSGGTASLALSNNATVTANPANLTIYTAPLIPLAALLAYVNLGQISVPYDKWLSLWTYGVGLFIAHYATLWARTSGNPATTVGQLANNGAVIGFQTSKAVGDVSVSQENMLSEAFADWGAFALTAWGVEFITLARVIGALGVYAF